MWTDGPPRFQLRWRAHSVCDSGRSQETRDRRHRASRLFSGKADPAHETAATAPLLVACAWVRAPSIEGPPPSAALCEAPTSSARSAASLGVITAGQRRESGALSGSGGAVLAGFLRCGWQVGASGRCEKHPIMALEPGKPLRRGPLSRAGTRARGQLLFGRAWTQRRVPAPDCAERRMTALALQHRPQRSGRSGGI